MTFRSAQQTAISGADAPAGCERQLGIGLLISNRRAPARVSEVALRLCITAVG